MLPLPAWQPCTGPPGSTAPCRDEAVAEHFARLVALERAAGRNPRVLDTLIAATAVTAGAAVATQDNDFDHLSGVPVVKV